MEFALAVLGVAIALLSAVLAFAQLRRTPKINANSTTEVSVIQHPSTLPTARVRHNLPPRGVLIGRAREVDRTLAGLASSHEIISIEGLGGVGKTALAREIGWSLVNSLTGPTPSPPVYEAVAWAEDTEGGLTLDRLLNIVLDVLEYPYIRTMARPAKTTEVLRKLQEHTSLVIVDNVETITDQSLLDFLVRIPNPSRVIVTTRERWTTSAWTVDLQPLDKGDGLALLRSEGLRLGVPPARMPNEYLTRLYDATGGNPLAIRFVVGQLKVGATLTDVLGDLINAHDEDIFSAIFDRIWNKLLKSEDPTRHTLLALSILPAPTRQDALAAATGLPLRATRAAIQSLTNLSLVNVVDAYEGVPPQFRLHALTRAFASRQLTRDRLLLAQMSDRLAEYFLFFSDKHHDTYANAANTYELDSERINLLFFTRYVYEQAEQSDDDEIWGQVLRFADGLGPYLWGRGLWAERVRLCEKAINAARRLNDGVAMAHQWANIGRINLWLGHIDVADACLAQSEAALPEDVSGVEKSLTKRLRAQIAIATSELDIAERLLLEILDVAPYTPDDQGRAATLVELGQIAAKRLDHAQARAYYTEALLLDESTGSIEGQALSLSQLGDAQIDLGDYKEAKEAFQRGIHLSSLIGRLSALARCEYGLARVFAAEGDINQSHQYAQRAERTATRLGLKKLAENARALMQVADAGAAPDE